MKLFYLGSCLKTWLDSKVESYVASRNGAPPELVEIHEGAEIPDQAFVVTDSAVPATAAVIVWVRSSASGSAPRVGEDQQLWVVPADEHSDQSFAQMMAYLALVEERRMVHELIVHPWVHDMNGVLGVVGLVEQILTSRAETSSLSTKLASARVKADALISDLAILSEPGLWSQDLRAEGLGLGRSQTASLISRLSGWMGSSHRGRSLQVTGQPDATIAAQESLEPVVRGMLDAAARLSSRESPIELSFTRGKIEVKAEGVELNSDQEKGLSIGGTEFDTKILPFRLLLAKVLSIHLGRSLGVEYIGKNLVIRSEPRESSTLS